MPSSLEADLPSVRRGLANALRMAYRAEPRALVLSFGLTALAFLTDGLAALWLKLLADGITHGRGGLLRTAILGMAASVAVGWVLRTAGSRLGTVLSQRVTVALEAHVARLQASITGLEHHERPDFLDRLRILRDHVFLLNHLYGAFINTIASVGRLVLVLGLLVSVHAGLLILAIFAVPTVWIATWRAGKERAAVEAGAAANRLARHLFDVVTTAGPGKEVRTSGAGARLLARRQEAWSSWYRPVMRTRWTGAAWQAGSWVLFGASYVGAIVFVASVLDAGPGDVLLVLGGGAALSRFLGTTVAEADFLRWTMDAARRLVWLQDYAAEQIEDAPRTAPGALRDGIRLEGVSFRYPGAVTDTLVLDDVNLSLPAGSVVAIVGENGAGKTTLVKLLAKFYAPTSGRITVDDTDLAHIPAEEWRDRMAGAFQDFARLELFARQTIGVGDLARAEEAPALAAAVDRGGAGDVVSRLPSGLETQLGPTWEGGVELSFGQWQRLALARGLMRDDPLLVVLDEPTAALDAESEHELFERFSAAARSDAAVTGRVTILVSHRFSTVRMADLIVVLDGARVTEVGTHAELVARGGTYADLYSIQARAYRT
jgi:ATP-binding cassette subfamily B protein